MNELKELGKKETMTSIEVSEATEKRHSDVMRDIRSLIEQGCSECNFALGSYTDKNNQKRPMYILTKKGSLILASGYNALLREKIINRWEELENQLSGTKPSYMIEDPIKRAEQWIIEQKEKKLLENKIEQQKPLVEFAETVSNSVNSISVGDFAKLLYDEDIKIGRNRLFEWFKKNKYLQRDKMPYQKYINSGYFEVIEQTYKTPYGNKVGFKTLVTGKGQIYFTETLRDKY